MGTLRTAADVDDLLKAAKDRDPNGWSATKIANEVMRRGLAEWAATPAPTAPVPAAPAPPAPGPAATGRRRRPPEPAVTTKCVVHPPGRVLDGMCMVCGGKA